MANYDTTICYIFDTAENVKKIFSQIIDENESEKLLDMKKIHSVPEELSLDDKKNG